MRKKDTFKRIFQPTSASWKDKHTEILSNIWNYTPLELGLEWKHIESVRWIYLEAAYILFKMLGEKSMISLKFFQGRSRLVRVLEVCNQQRRYSHLPTGLSRYFNPSPKFSPAIFGNSLNFYATTLAKIQIIIFWSFIGSKLSFISESIQMVRSSLMMNVSNQQRKK